MHWSISTHPMFHWEKLDLDSAPSCSWKVVSLCLWLVYNWEVSLQPDAQWSQICSDVSNINGITYFDHAAMNFILYFTVAVSLLLLFFLICLGSSSEEKSWSFRLVKTAFWEHKARGHDEEQGRCHKNHHSKKHHPSNDLQKVRIRNPF